MSPRINLMPCTGYDLLGQTSTLPRDANAGLVWSRYLKMWEGRTDDPSLPKSIKPILVDFSKEFNDRGEGARNPARDLLRLNRERLQRAFEVWAKTRGWFFSSLDFHVVWRLVTGQGNRHPTSANLAFDPVIGVPFLTGSAVKGLCRTMARLQGNDPAEIERLFGPESAQVERISSRREVAFFDALPRRWPKLDVDLINCHHQDYYGEARLDRLKDPLETESPIPVNFLCVKKDTVFVFPLAGKQKKDVEVVEDLLGDGLSTLGIGGKTAVGYGVMSDKRASTGDV